VTKNFCHHLKSEHILAFSISKYLQSFFLDFSFRLSLFHSWYLHLIYCQFDKASLLICLSQFINTEFFITVLLNFIVSYSKFWILYLQVRPTVSINHRLCFYLKLDLALQVDLFFLRMSLHMRFPFALIAAYFWNLLLDF
jgi:hypothetical protein